MSEQEFFAITPTNDINDSKGVVSFFGFNLEGNLVFIPLSGVALSIFTCLFFFTGAPSMLLGKEVGKLVISCPFFLKLIFVLSPFTFSFLWVLLFIHKKPPRFQKDLFSSIFLGKGFETQNIVSRRCNTNWNHPRLILIRKDIERNKIEETFSIVTNIYSTESSGS